MVSHRPEQQNCPAIRHISGGSRSWWSPRKVHAPTFLTPKVSLRTSAKVDETQLAGWERCLPDGLLRHLGKRVCSPFHPAGWKPALPGQGPLPSTRRVPQAHHPRPVTPPIDHPIRERTGRSCRGVLGTPRRRLGELSFDCSRSGDRTPVRHLPILLLNV